MRRDEYLVKVSIIVPVYNVEKYIDKCINSILNQTFEDFELILVDDGSTDKSGEICDKYKKQDKRIKVIHKTNGGLSDARNVGIDNSLGEFITFIDSDDYVDEDIIEFLYDNLKKHHCDISICNAREIYTDYVVYQTKEDIEMVVSGKEAVRYELESKVLPGYSVAKLYEKNKIFKDIRFPIGKLYEDAFIIVKALDLGERVYISTKAKYNYIRRDGSITVSSFKTKDLNCIEAHQANYEYIMCKYPEFEKQGFFRVIWSKLFILDKILISPEKDSEIAEKLIKSIKDVAFKSMSNPYLSFKRKIGIILIFINRNLYRKFLK